MARQKKTVPRTQESYAIVGDGQTEAWYMQMLKRNEPNVLMKLKPEIPSKKSLKEQFEFVCSLSKKEYSKVIWIVDLDTILSESKLSPKGKKSPIQHFISYREKLRIKFPNVLVIVNNPCLELWFLLHFKQTQRAFDNCSKTEKELKKLLPDYDKSLAFFTKEGKDIYQQLKPHLSAALATAERLGTFTEANPSQSISEMHVLFKVLGLGNC